MNYEHKDMSASLIAEEEIVSWWSGERGRVKRECDAFREKTITELRPLIEELHGSSLVGFGDGWKKIKKELRRRSTEFLAGLEVSLESELITSERRSGELELDNNVKPEEVGLASIVGFVGLGSIGAAVAATGAATTVTTTSFLGLITTGTVFAFSWPVFLSVSAVAVAGAGAASLGSTRIVRMRRNSLQKALEASLDRFLFSSKGKGNDSVVSVTFKRLDEIRDLRLNAVRNGMR